MKKLNRISLFVLGLLSPAFAFAAQSQITPYDPTGQTTFSFLKRFQAYLLGFAGAVAIFFVVYGGLQMILSRGNPQKLEVAKKTLTYAIIGLIVVILAQAILIILTGAGGPFQSIFGSGTESL